MLKDLKILKFRIMEKTNVMRILDKNKLNYKTYDYSNTDAISWIDVANVMNQNQSKVFKTLVTVWKSKKYYVFMVPVDKDLDLKKAANSVDEKSIEMIKSKDLLWLTWYIHWGCSPIWMKKNFKTIIDVSAKNFPTIIFSAGKIGYQVELNVDDLSKMIETSLYDIVI